MNTRRNNRMFRGLVRFLSDVTTHPGKYLNVFSMPARKQIHFLINLLGGLIISLGLHAAEHVDAGEWAVNLVSDALIRLETSDTINRLKAVFVKPADKSRVAYINIDSETYRQWQMPLLAPRDRLTEYITLAAHHGAAVVVLDILTDYADCCSPSSDAKLRSLLTSLSEGGSPTKIILPEAIDSSNHVRKSIFDNLVDGKTIFRGIPYGSASRDRVTRYWIAYRIGTEGKSDKVVLWGIPLLAAMVSDNRYNELKELEDPILKQVPGVPTQSQPNILTFSDHKKIRISLDNEDIYTQRIRFLTLPDKGDSLSYIRSALYLKEPDSDTDREASDRKFFSGKIVVIGNSSPDQGDIHFTSLGDLAGLFIIGNAAATIREGLQPAPLPRWAIYLVEFMAIVVASYAFLYMSGFWANFFASTIMLSILIPATIFFYFYFGVLINAVFPVLGMSLHQVLARGEEGILEWWGVRFGKSSK